MSGPAPLFTGGREDRRREEKENQFFLFLFRQFSSDKSLFRVRSMHIYIHIYDHEERHSSQR